MFVTKQLVHGDYAAPFTQNSVHPHNRAAYLCERMFKPGCQYKKAGVMLSEISPVTHRQGDLLEPERVTNGKFMLALDTLNQRFGRGTFNVTTQGAYTEWQMRRERKSPAYTTSWDEVPVV